MEATNPLFALLRQLNAADIVFIIIVFRILYIAFENGFVVECFKLTGIVLATYIGLHYYSRLAVFSRDFLSLGKET